MTGWQKHLRYLAIVDGIPGDRVGYVIDYMPDEAEMFRRDYGTRIVGEFATWLEAQKAIMKRLGELGGGRFL